MSALSRSRTALLAFTLLLAGGTAGLQAQSLIIEKKLAQCPPPGPCRAPISTVPGVTSVRYELRIENVSNVSFSGVRVIDDMPANALDFRVTNRGNGQPCGSPGNPVCSNVPAPGGANGAGQIVIDNIALSRAGGLLSEITIAFEIDFSCPPTRTGDVVANQAQVFTTSHPTFCNPCLSDDPLTGAPGDATAFTAACLPPAEMALSKTASVSEWRPGQDPTINYRITLTNSSTTDTILGSELQIFERLPTLGGSAPAFNTDLTCPLRITTTPAVPISIDNSFCRDSPWTVNLSSFPDLAPGQTFIMDFSVEMREDLPDTFGFCNRAEVYYGVTGATTNVSACTTVVIPQTVDFRSSVKSVAPQQPRTGFPVTYSIAVTNSGTGPATGVILTDIFPSCVSDTDFDPATSVRVDPGPAAGPITYVGRTLTVPLGNMASSVTQNVYISGFRSVDPVCCNQAFVTANELPAPGHPTGASSGPGDRSCYGPSDVDFRQSVKSVTPVPIESGGPLTYTVTVTNSGAGTATNVVVSDVLPDCVDDAGFDPATDIAIQPGPASSVSYQRASRLLTVRFDRIGALQTQTITITGLVGGSASASCCNQALISSDEVPLPDVTGETPGSGSPTCAAVVSVGCNLNRGVATSRGQIGPLFSSTCQPGDVRLGTAGQILDVVTGQLVDTISAGPGLELTLYQIDCSCGNDIRMVKDPGPPRSVRLEL